MIKKKTNFKVITKKKNKHLDKNKKSIKKKRFID